MQEQHPAVACSEDEFAALAECELEALPDWIKSAIASHNVAISIEDQHPKEPRILGLFARYSGTAEIILYRLPISRVAVDRRHLRRAIRDTLLHELGHLFGMTESDLDHYSIGNNPLPDADRVHPGGDGRADNK
jgi:predicted Zn-dependent protease with MMP-like domain